MIFDASFDEAGAPKGGAPKPRAIMMTDSAAALEVALNLLRSILSILLLAFVAATVATILFGSPPDANAPANAHAAPLAPKETAPDRREGEPGTTEAPTPEARRFVAWYLHGPMRCRTCRSIEDISHRAITTAFDADLRAGRVAWRSANFEDASVAPLATRFGVTGSSLVIAEHRGAEPGEGEVVRHLLLAKTWDLVDDERALGEYVVMALDAFMAASPTVPDEETGPDEEAAP